jgi:hypothetical protein
MPFTRTWDASYEALPTDSNYGYEIDNYIRQVILDVRERMSVEHEWKNGQEDGKHIILPFWVPITTFTATPASTSTITLTSDLTASAKVGMSLKYVYEGSTYYGRIGAITSNLLTVNGIALDLNHDITALHFGGGTIRQIVITIPNEYEDASNTALITSDLLSSLIWDLDISYLVKFKVYSNTADTSDK